ncbi:MAG: amidohydrolase family protein [Candidatus Cloacimonetes bacterium]|nr:amidohydrolase family protein [Candidatus Cloacimonadota bacterium]
MKIKLGICVHSPDRTSLNFALSIHSAKIRENVHLLELPDSIAYPPFINSHDHLIGNWVPRAGENNPYPTTDIWVEEMKNSPSFQERNKVWFNDGTFELTHGNAPLLAKLGVYKNIFSGCAIVQDHGPNQKDEYYDMFPVNVIRDYRQCHSLSLGNWWGGGTAVEEWQKTEGRIPFILHLAEGTDEAAKAAFSKLEQLNLLQPNILIIHGIAMNEYAIARCAEIGASICCCPESNMFLIGKTIDIDSCLKKGVNLVLGTDSTMSGSTNLLTEIRQFKHYHPWINSSYILSMITRNAVKALMLPVRLAEISNSAADLVITSRKHPDPFENLLYLEMEDIKLLLHDGTPIYGDRELLDVFEINPDDYFFFQTENSTKFVIGQPQKITARIDEILGYHKQFPYLPF